MGPREPVNHDSTPTGSESPGSPRGALRPAAAFSINLLRAHGLQRMRDELVARRFEEMDANAASLGARRLRNERRFVAQLSVVFRAILNAFKIIIDGARP
jgi:hypothetical protein